jgi:hypothetical protein
MPDEVKPTCAEGALPKVQAQRPEAPVAQRLIKIDLGYGRALENYFEGDADTPDRNDSEQ